MALQPESCLKVLDGICKLGSNKPVFKAFLNLTLDLILDPSLSLGFYSHPMNSQTSCMAFCAAKSGLKTVIVQGKICACIAGNVWGYTLPHALNSLRLDLLSEMLLKHYFVKK